jgi:HAMP domain-containing protein
MNKISFKVALLVNCVTAVVIFAGSLILIEKQSQSLESEFFNRGKIQSVIGAKIVGEIISQAIDNGVFSLEDAFDTDYKPIGNIFPPKYHTKYDVYLDKTVLNIEDEFLIDESIIFAVAVDLNGYLPVHNTRFQAPIAGDQRKDLAGNRTKRIFNDKVGLAAAKNPEKGFLQIYHRDTGEVIWDISSPIFVKGRHWGGFRVGLSLDSINSAKRKLVMTLVCIMAMIWVIAMAAIFVTVKKALVPLERLTKIAKELNDSIHLERRITVTRKDEIGNLEDALERLRLKIIMLMGSKRSF